MNIILLFLSTGLCFSTYFLQGMNKKKREVTQEQRQLLGKYSNPKGPLSFAGQLTKRVDTKNIDILKKEFKEVFSILNLGFNGYVKIMQNFLRLDYEERYFIDKKIDIGQFVVAPLKYDKKTILNSFGHSLLVVRTSQVINHFIYDHGVRIDHKEKKLRSSDDYMYLELDWIKKELKAKGFRIGNTLYAALNTHRKYYRFEVQTPESRLQFFKEMLKPRMSQEVRKEIVQKNLTFMLCLNNLVKNKKLYSKIPKPVLLDFIIRPSLPDGFLMVCDTIKIAVDQYKEKVDKNSPDEVDRFLCNEFVSWYKVELEKCLLKNL